jgi:hypothetical protein
VLLYSLYKCFDVAFDVEVVAVVAVVLIITH